MSDPPVGTVLGGKYVVEGILGRGGMGVVVAARHRALDQRVAIKCLLPHALTLADVVERFAREARAAAKIEGEHVARVIDVGRFEDGTPYMVMEHLQGHDLSVELEQRGTIPPSDAIRYVLETCEALAQAHAMRIVHRDLKPSNLFLAQQPGRRPIIKVLDFGISKVVDPGAHSLTKTSSVLGTPYYMSPEQLLSSKSVDERSDIWSLGVVLYELVIGQPPFAGETAHEIIAKIVQNAPQPPRSLRPDLPPALEAVILQCMRTNVDERFANVAQLAAALMPCGAPSDRESVTAIARVLGLHAPQSSFAAGEASTQPAPHVPYLGPIGPQTAAQPTRISAQPPPPAAPGPFRATAVSGPPLQGPPPGGSQYPARTSVATAHDVTPASPRDASRVARWAWVLAAVFGTVAALAGGAVVFLRHSSSAAPPGNSAGLTLTATPPPTASAVPPPSAALTPLPPEPTLASPAPSASATASVAASAIAPAAVAGRSARPVASPPNAGPPAGVRAAASTAATPPPAAKPPPMPSNNPLDLQLK
jgi:serine/threonine protein kinase